VLEWEKGGKITTETEIITASRKRSNNNRRNENQRNKEGIRQMKNM
jgi:hypothetical protein